MQQKVAIVATVRNIGRPLNSFIRYHLAIGFDHLFLFFDDPNDPSIADALTFDRVTVIQHDKILREKWKKGKLYASLAEFIELEAMARQQLNAEVAIQLALERQFDWALHIDGDELFYSPHQTVAEHFKSLRARNVQVAEYFNYEAIPERVDIHDYFVEATLFKQNLLGMSEQWLDEKKRKLILNVPQLTNRFFLFYMGSKSSVRLSDSVVPAGPHEFHIVKDGRTMKITKSADGEKAPMILHYPCCGLEHFWNKYVTLGTFGDKWYGKVDIANAVPFHLKARDVVARGNKQAAREFYEKQVVISDESQVRQLIAEGLCLRIHEPSRLILRETSSLNEPSVRASH